MIIDSIVVTTTRSGLDVYARLDNDQYPKVKVSGAQLAAVNITGHEFHQSWTTPSTQQLI
ncbi:MAG TPA: hypothetical protein VF526_22735 [Solirubrobacteraceae bacterium]